VAIKADWTSWHLERSRFLARDTEGFTKDLKAFEQHIKNLTELSPKDTAGFPVGQALFHIDKFHAEYNRFKKYLEINSSLKQTSQD